MRKTFTLLFLPLLMLVCTNLYAQVKTVSGKVTATSDGTPLPGVSIKLKGTTTGTSTNAQGGFSIQVNGTDAILTFSFVGYLPKEVAVGSQTTISVSLAEDSQQLQEVVVSTALGITRQAKSLGYSAQSVNSKDLNFNHQPNLINALQGKVAGATISSTGWPRSGCQHSYQRGELY